jgi:hypothetical protein
MVWSMEQISERWRENSLLVFKYLPIAESGGGCAERGSQRDVVYLG